jgi:hypothetical protein
MGSGVATNSVMAPWAGFTTGLRMTSFGRFLPFFAAWADGSPLLTDEKEIKVP